MRILAFSDLHRDRDAAQAVVDASADADVVVGAGDFATEGSGLTDTFDVLKRVSAPIVLVAGNHDSLDDMLRACRDWPAAHILHGDGAVIQGIPFFGLGYEIPAGNAVSWNQRMEESDAAVLLEPCPADAVLVTHSPPYGVADLQRNGIHEGSRTIGEAVERCKPRLHLCGHIHNAWGTWGTIGACPVHNLGPTVNWFNV
jgi:uncharacterized protein